ncbi:MAG: translocation/assembly module TamB domain-containing protein [Paracoccaceae bacterium]
MDRGGRVTVTGPVTLQPPFAGSLAAVLQGVVLTDPELFTTTANGRLTIDGPLTGGALIVGAVTLGTTEVQVPSSVVSATGPIPVITHVNEPDAVRDTRGRARLIPGVNGARRGGGPGYSLDLTVSAPTRIFIRGRGIDAELGGQVRLTGTTRNVLPAGQFALIRGRLDILGQRLRLTEGEAQLQGAFSPYLRLVAQAEAGEYTVFVTLSGPADAPEITFRSTPELPEDEVLAQLLFGRSLTELSALQAARLAVAVAELAGVGGLDILGSLRGIAGLADLDVTTTDSGGTAVTAGAYLGENVYTDVTVQDGSTEINLNLDLSPSVTARGSVNTKGETGLGIFFERDY